MNNGANLTFQTLILDEVPERQVFSDEKLFPHFRNQYFTKLEFTKSHHRRSYCPARICEKFGFELANLRFSGTIFTTFQGVSEKMNTLFPHFHDLYFTNLKLEFTKTHHRRSYSPASFCEKFGFRPNLRLLNERLLTKMKGTTVIYKPSSIRISNKIIG